MVGFIFGGNTGLNYEDLQSRRATADALAKRIMGQQPKNVGEGIGALLQGAAAGIGRYRADKGLKEGRDQASTQFNDILSKITGQPVPDSNNNAASLPMPAAAGEMAANDPAPDVSKNGSTFSPFIDTVKTGIKTGEGNTLAITNPYGLAAVAATGKAESGWSPANANRSWSDPSESGQAGTAGGVMSWRADRLEKLQSYARAKGEQGNGSPQTQAEFFLQEDPQLVSKLNSAKSTEEAQSLMNGAWKFRGYNRPGGEAGRRMGLANAYVSQFADQPSNQVASLDPSAGMSAASAIERQAPASGYVDPQVAAPNTAMLDQQPAFDAGRFGDPIKLSEMPAAMNDARQRLSAQASAYAANPMMPIGGLQAMPQNTGQQPSAPQQPAFDAGRFGDPIPSGPQESQQAPQPALVNAYAPPQQPAGALGPLPSRDIASAPQVASVAQPQGGVQPPAAGQTQMAQAQPYQIDPQVLQFLSSPFADEGQKQAVRMVIQQKMQASQQAQEEQQWRGRQEYEQQLRQNDPLYKAQVDKASRPGYRMLSSQERQAFGIPQDDTRPYQVGPEGQVQAIGGMGQAQTPGVEARQRRALAIENGIDPNSSEGQRFILTGTLPASDRGVTAGDREAIREADDQIQASQSAMDQLQSVLTPGENGQSLNDRAGSGALADWQSWAARNDPTGFFDDSKGEATTELNNTVLGQALGSLKSIFGAAPTEGERQILLDMQASVDKTPAERKIIIEKATKLAQRRMQYNQDRANDLRGGTYYKSDRGAPNVQTNAPQTPNEAAGMPRRPEDQRGPQPGAVEDGYRFKGGNPSDPANWEQVR